jgi:formylglycine-generating enzyme required for sulfatase activity
VAGWRLVATPLNVAEGPRMFVGQSEVNMGNHTSRRLAIVLSFLSAVTAYATPGSPAQENNDARDLTLEPIAKWPTSAKRWALVIGVDRYRDKQIGPLHGATNDAKSLAEVLVRYAGFPSDQVILLASDQPEEREPTRVNILRRLANLSSLIPKDGLLLVSFAGHGIQRRGQAFLMPSDAQVSNDIRFLEETALSVTHMHEWIRTVEASQVIIILDACRNDPTGRADAPNLLTEAYTKAFNFDVRNREVEAFATFYATDVGQHAYEYAEKHQGYFTWAFVQGLTGGAANEKGEVTLAQLRKYVQDTVPRRISIDLGADRLQQPIAAIEGYLAEELVVAVTATSDTPKSNENVAQSVLRPVSMIPVGRLPNPHQETLADSKLRRELSRSDVVLSAKDNLEYAWIPAGTFHMGCVKGDDQCLNYEKPNHEVTFTRGFWMARTPVTVNAYRRFATNTGCSMPPEPGFKNQRVQIPDFNPGWTLEKHPIVNVNWNEASEYCKWVGGRLPTEAEWEYASRGEADGWKYPWGNSLTRDDANYGKNECCRQASVAADKWDYTSPVASFPPNGYGLYDMAGNVYQWVADFFSSEYYANSTSEDPSGPSSGSLRTVRGGSWSNDARFLRASFRYAVTAHDRNHYIGFRCVVDEVRTKSSP